MSAGGDTNTLSHRDCLYNAKQFSDDVEIDAEINFPIDPYIGEFRAEVLHAKEITLHGEGLGCLFCLCQQICCLHDKVQYLSPRKLHRTCSRTFSYHQGRMRCVKILLVLLCVVMLLTCGVVIMENDFRGRRDFYLDDSSFNTDRPFKDIAINKTNALKNVPKRKRKASLGNMFNAHTWSNETANTRKHYLILYWSKIRGHVARLQRKEEYEKDQHIWPYTHVGDQCPISCELTNDRSRAKEADVFVVHSRLTDVWDFPPFEYLAPWILQNNENPVYTAAMTDPRIMNKFNLLISYRLDSDFPSPIYPMPSLSEPIPFDQRLGDVLAVFSKCEVVRTEYMRQLMRYIDVHSYGSCLRNKDGLIGLYGQVNGKYVFKDYKLVLTRFYKFSLVFMNQDCDYFVDDRLYHALETGSVPVYMGTDKVDEFLPGNLKNAIIRVSDFNSPKELAKYLKYLSNNETAYNKYLEWKKIGLGYIDNTTIGHWWKQKYPLFCQVCMRLSQGSLHPGLDVDVCKARSYLDWNLYSPYGVDNIPIKEIVREEDSSIGLYVYVVGFVFGLILVTANVAKVVIKIFMIS